MPAMVLIPTAVALLLAAVFGYAAVAKLAAPRRWRTALGGYDLPPRLRRPALVVVPLAEGAAALLLTLSAARAGAALGLALLSAFSLAVVRARARRGERLPCGCFGRSGVRDARLMLIRNALLAALCVAVLLVGPRAGAVSVAPRVLLLPASLTGLGLAVALWLVWQARAAMRGGRP
jgi:hypothetical protein